MTPSRSNYDKARDATAAVFLRYDQAAMIRKFGLSHDADALYITFIARDYRVDRRTGAVTWASEDARTASYNEAMSIYDVLCDSQPLCHLSHEWVNVASLCSIQGGTLSKDGDFFKNSCARFSGDRLYPLCANCHLNWKKMYVTLRPTLLKGHSGNDDDSHIHQYDRLRAGLLRCVCMLRHEQHYSVPGRRHSAGVHYYSAGICQLLHMPEHDVPFPLPALVRTTTATAARGSAIRRSLFFS